MTTEVKSILRPYQEGANIAPHDRHFTIEELKPMNEEQERLKSHLLNLLDRKVKTVLVCGTTGNGKTFLSCAALNSQLKDAYIDSKPTGYYITQKELEMEFRSAMHSTGTSEMQVFNRFCKFPLLVIDEIGRGSNTSYSMDNLEAIIAKRYSWDKQTILVSNETATEIRTLFDRHILDRLAMGATIEMKEKSLRAKGESR